MVKVFISNTTSDVEPLIDCQPMIFFNQLCLKVIDVTNVCAIHPHTGINHEGRGERVPHSLEWRTLVQIVRVFSTNTAQNSQKHATSSEKFIFFWSIAPDPSPMDSAPHPNQAFWIGLCFPLRIPAMQVTPMYVYSRPLLQYAVAGSHRGSTQ